MMWSPRAAKKAVKKSEAAGSKRRKIKRVRVERKTKIWRKSSGQEL